MPTRNIFPPKASFNVCSAMIQMGWPNVNDNEDGEQESVVQNALEVPIDDLVAEDELRDTAESLLELWQMDFKAGQNISKAKKVAAQAKKEFDAALDCAVKVFKVEDHLEDMSSDKEDEDF